MKRLLLLAAALLVVLPAAAQPRLFNLADEARATLSDSQAIYLGHLEALPAAAETRLVEVELGALDADAVTFNLAPEATVTLTRSRVERRLGDGASYVFESDDEATFAVVVERGGQLTGNVRTGGRLYTVRPLTGGLHAVVRLDESRFVDHPPGWEAVEAEAARRWAERPYVPRAGQAPDHEHGGFIQRVLVPYTPTAAAQVADILALIQLAFDETNLGYDRSDIYVYLELAYAFPTEQGDQGTIATMLWRLEDPDDGWYDDVVLRRGPYGADLVIMIVGTNSSACGYSSTILATGVADSYAVAAQDCATGYYTFGHELGHLQGARHNPEADPNTQPFPYGHGKYVQRPEGWRTVMSYDCPGGCTRILNWSNPDVDHLGVPTGDAALRDNARVLDTTALDIAAIAGLFTAPMARVELEILSGSILPAPGGVVRFEATVVGRSTNFSGWVWITATLPNGTPYGVIFGPQLVRLSAGQGFTRALQINVPGAAPAGFYEIAIYAGSYPDAVVAFDNFSFVKLSPEPVGSDAPGLATLTVADVTDDAPEAPAAASTRAEGYILASYPNPFSTTVSVAYTLSERAAVRLAVYDVLGREVAVLVDEVREAGAHVAEWEPAARLPAGAYLCRIEAGAYTEARQMMLVR